MNYRDYLNNQDEPALLAYAERAETTIGYIQRHYLANPPSRTPRRDKFELLSSATNGDVSKQEVLEHFYGQMDKAANE